MPEEQTATPSEPLVPTVTATPTASQADTTINPDQGSKYTLKHETDRINEDIKELKKSLIDERLNNITIFGIFASLVTFLSVEIQVFKNIDNFWLLIGLSTFLVSSLLLFVFSIHSIARNKLRWKDFLSTPIFWLFILFLLFSFAIFALNSKGINIDFHVQS